MSGWLPSSYNPSGDSSFNPSWEDSFNTKLDIPKSNNKPTAMDFLKTFSATLGEGLLSRDRNAAQKGLSEVVKSAYGASSSKGGLNDDLTIINPGAPTIIPRSQGSGLGGAIGSALGAVAGSFFGAPQIGASIGGGIGSAF